MLIRIIVTVVVASTIFLSLPLFFTSQVRAEEHTVWDQVKKFFERSSKGLVEEVVQGSGSTDKVEEVKPPSFFQRFFDFIKKFSISLPKPAKKETPIKNPFPTPPPREAPKIEERSILPQPESAGEPISFPKTTPKPTPITQSNLSGKWLGRYTVNTPPACKGESGAWTANLTQQANKLTGSFQSDAGSGSISGTVVGQNLSWSVGGGGSGISFDGGSSSPNTISGSFTGPICDPEAAPQKTQGTFFGGR